MAANTNGLIYYKLDASTHGYPGDVTKNCGLRGEEIDGNFNFLRGHDVESISFDEYGTMYLKRYNGETLTARQSDTPEYDFNYNPENGQLTIVTPDGKEIILEGFKNTTNVYHDFTLDGIGSQELPLGLSNISKTGRYKPAIKLIDTTIEDDNGKRVEDLPVENVAKHDRYVTREKISRFGRLFSLTGVEKIGERLEKINSEWRIPTKEEWDEMLNVIDCATPDHDKTDSNVYLGEFAGSALKTTTYWEPTKNGKILSEDKYGFSIYPVGYCGNRGTKYYGSFGESSCFWTSTEEDNHKDMYVKTFDYNTEAVGQRTWGENYYLSIRLVKTFTGNNFNDAEDIDGFTYNCIHVPGTSTIWTKENIAFSQEQYDGFVPEEWEQYENLETDEQSYVIRYFVNDWNGNGWDKHEIKEGEGIVLYEGANGRMHEWLLIDGELIDSAIHIKNEFKSQLDEIHQRIDGEITERIEGDKQLWDAFNQESSARIEGDKQLWDAFNQESQAREEVDKQLWASLENFGQALEQETNARVAADELIFKNLETETTDRVNADKQLWSALEDEIATRLDSDSNLQRQINENKVIPSDNSVVIVPGVTDEEGNTTSTTIKVNIDSETTNNTIPNHIVLGENGLYFDGYFGTF